MVAPTPDLPDDAPVYIDIGNSASDALVEVIVNDIAPTYENVVEIVTNA